MNPSLKYFLRYCLTWLFEFWLRPLDILAEVKQSDLEITALFTATTNGLLLGSLLGAVFWLQTGDVTVAFAFAVAVVGAVMFAITRLTIGKSGIPIASAFVDTVASAVVGVAGVGMVVGAGVSAVTFVSTMGSGAGASTSTRAPWVAGAVAFGTIFNNLVHIIGIMLGLWLPINIIMLVIYFLTCINILLVIIFLYKLATQDFDEKNGCLFGTFATNWLVLPFFGIALFPYASLM